MIVNLRVFRYPIVEQGEFFGPSSTATVWKQACQVDPLDFKRLKQLSFHYLLSAHGDPLLNDAHQQVANSIEGVQRSRKLKR